MLDDAVEVLGESACRCRNVGREVEVVAEIDNEHDRKVPPDRFPAGVAAAGAC